MGRRGRGHSTTLFIVRKGHDLILVDGARPKFSFSPPLHTQLGTLIQSACQNSRDSSTEASVQSDGSSTVSGTWRLGGRGGEIKESGASTILASRRATKANWPDKSSYFLFPATLLQCDSSGPCPPENGVSAVLFLFEKSIRMSSCTHSHVKFESDGTEGPPVMVVSDDMFKRGTGRCCVRSSSTTTTSTNNGKVYHFLDVQELK